MVLNVIGCVASNNTRLMRRMEMECELEEYLSNIGLSSSMLHQSTSSSHDQARPASAADVSHRDVSDEEDDDDAARRAAVDLTSAVNGGHDDEHLTMSASVHRTDTAAADDHADCDPARSENPTPQHAVLLSPADYDDDTSPLQQSSHNDNSAVRSYRQQNGHVGPTRHIGESPHAAAAAATLPPRGSRSAVVFSTVPRRVDDTSRTSRAPTSSSSCTIMLSGEMSDGVGRSSPATDGRSERPVYAADAAAAQARKTPVDGMPYSSTIVRCSASLAPVIATSKTKSRDADAPVDHCAAPPPPPHVKTARNYVSVVQIGSTTSTERRDPLPLMTMSTESLSVDAGSSVTLGRSSPSTGHLRAHVAGTVDPAGCTPIKSSLKKVSPVHAKSKSVSFSAAGSAADDDDDDVDDDATTGERAARDSPVVRVHDRARPDGGIGPRRALVSDSGVFCDADDEVAVVDDSKPTTASPPSRRTTVSVSCGMAAVNLSLIHI